MMPTTAFILNQKPDLDALLNKPNIPYVTQLQGPLLSDPNFPAYLSEAEKTHRLSLIYLPSDSSASSSIFAFPNSLSGKAASDFYLFNESCLQNAVTQFLPHLKDNRILNITVPVPPLTGKLTEIQNELSQKQNPSRISYLETEKDRLNAQIKSLNEKCEQLAASNRISISVSERRNSDFNRQEILLNIVDLLPTDERQDLLRLEEEWTHVNSADVPNDPVKK